MIGTAEEQFGKLDVLFNNAGFGGPIMPLHEQTVENWETVQGTNLKGVFLGMNTAFRRCSATEVAQLSTRHRLPDWSV